MSGAMSLTRNVWFAAAALVATRAAVWLFWANLAPPDPRMTAVALLLDVTLLVLATTQAWRIANYDRQTGAALFVKIICLVLTVTSLENMANQIARTAARPAPLPDPPAMLPVTGTSVTLSGAISFASFNALRATLASNPGIDTVTLDSPGGLIPAARGLARVITETGLNTHVTGTCASACTLVFLAGQIRTMDPGAQIGFHGYRFMGNVNTLDVAAEQDRDQRYLAARGVTPEFIQRAYGTPFDDMWLPERAELLAAGVLTR